MMSHDGERLRSLLGALQAYCGVYLYSVMTLTVFAATLRAIAEHQHGKDGAVEAGEAVLRNFTCGPFSRLVFGAYGFSEHATHHEEPAIPCYNLRAATAHLSAVDPALAPRGGYLRTLVALVRQGDGSPPEDRPRSIPAIPPASDEPWRGEAGILARAIGMKASR